MRIVKLGNSAALDRGIRLEGKRVTTIYANEPSLQEQMRTITHADGIWPQHSRQPAVWVESNDEGLEAALAEHFGCPIGRPDNWPAE
jgi:hypothetical protein